MCKRHAMILFLVLLAALAAASCRPLLAAEPASTSHSVSFATAHSCVEPPSRRVSWWSGDGAADDNGLIDEVELYSRALSAGELATLFDARSIDDEVGKSRHLALTLQRSW
jgi:hypothetical protein